MFFFSGNFHLFEAENATLRKSRRKS